MWLEMDIASVWRKTRSTGNDALPELGFYDTVRIYEIHNEFLCNLSHCNSANISQPPSSLFLHQESSNYLLFPLVQVKKVKESDKSGKSKSQVSIDKKLA